MTSPYDNPDGRDLLDFADAVNAGEQLQPQNELERAYLHVQNTMRGESSTLPSDLKQSTWEDVMSTLALAPDRPVSNRTKRNQAIASPRFTPKRLRWTPLASIAAAALVILASFATWYTYSPGEPTPPPAPQLAGIIDGSEVAQVQGTPEATAVEETPSSRSIPIVQHVDEQPMDGPVIWLTNSGDVMYDDGTDVQTVATDVEFVQPGMPNVIQLTTEGEEVVGKDGNPVGSYTQTYYNLLTGETLVDSGNFSSYLGGHNMYGPLTVRTIADAPSDWSVVNFDTMQSISIADLTGGHFPANESITVSVADDHSAIAIGTSQYESEASAILMRQSGLPGEVAVISADLEIINWLTVPEDMPPVGNISLSPDGSKLTFISTDYFSGGSTTIVSVVDVNTNEEVTRTSAIESSSHANIQWVENSSALVIVSDTSVQRYAFDGSDATTLFESEGTIRLMPQFGESNLLHLEVTSEDNSTPTPTADMYQFVILNTETGQTVTVDGDPWDIGGSFPVQLSTTLAPIPVSQDGRTAELVHPITGELYADLQADVYDPPVDPESMEPMYLVQTVTTAQRAPISIVRLSDGSLAVFNTSTDSFVATEITLPEGEERSQLQLSPDGSYLLAGASWETQEEDDTYFVLDLSDEDAEWVQGEPGQRITFVEIRED